MRVTQVYCYISRNVCVCIVDICVCMDSVVRHHRWMEDPILRFQTGSEPLSLEEEYKMQLKWQQDEDSKSSHNLILIQRRERVSLLFFSSLECTFICLDRSSYDKNQSHEEGETKMRKASFLLSLPPSLPLPSLSQIVWLEM